MAKKITDMKGLHAGLEFQDKFLLKNKTSPGRDLLAMKLLGVDAGFLNNLESKSGINMAELSNKRKQHKNIYDLLYSKGVEAFYPEDIPLDIQSCSYDPNKLTSTHYDVSWTKTKKNKSQTLFELEGSDELSSIVKKLLNFDGDERCINLIILFPITGLLNYAKDQCINLGWDIYENVFDEGNSSDECLALLIALQILTKDKIDDKTSFDLVEKTIFRKYFNSFDLSEGKNKRYFAALKKPNSNFIHMTVNDNCHDFSKIKKRNKDRSKTEKNIRFNKEQSWRDVENNEICDEDINSGDLVIGKVTGLKKESGEYKLERDFESAAYGLRLLMSQVPGVLCNIKIPFNRDFPGINKNVRSQEKGETWVVGPEYWVDFIQRPPKKAVDKPGIYDKQDAVRAGNDESTKVIYEFGDCIHNNAYLEDDANKDGE